MIASEFEELRLAAIAAGHKPARLTDDSKAFLLEGLQKAWNPLNDDGDALRLFAALPGCRLEVSDIGVTVFLPHAPGTVGLMCSEYGPEHGSRLDLAARRAIVRAAAEIGKQMGGGNV